MVLVLTDEELMQVSTSDLRTLFETKEISAEEHRQLRGRRRRLQNRKYARKCARKKQTEVELLTSEVEEEKLQIQLLRRQLSRVKLSTQRMQHQIVRIASFHQDCLKASITSARDCSQSASSPSSDQPTLRIVTQDGKQSGLAVFESARTTTTTTTTVPTRCRTSPSAPLLFPTESLPPIKPAPHPRSCSSQYTGLRLPMHGQYHSPVGRAMPTQLIAGPGLPTNSQTHFSPMQLVRPVGCGWASNSGLSEF